MLAVVCPGQGAQKPGMLAAWLEIPGMKATVERYGAAADLDLVALGTTGTAQEITDTSVAQPLIVATSLLSLRAALQIADDEPLADAAFAAGIDVVAGHSVGEFAAAAIAGVLEEEAALTLVGQRGRAMAEAAAQTPTGMAAVIGGNVDEVRTWITDHGLVPANVNGGGQVVAAGSKDQLAELAAAPLERTRVVPLQVAGAFHTDYMASAQREVAKAAAAMTAQPARVSLLSNADGRAVSGPDALARLVSQITSPVRWDLCQEAIATRGIEVLLELAPAGVLSGLARKALPDVRRLPLKSPADLADVQQVFVNGADS